MAAARTSGSLSWDRHLAHYLNQVRNFSLLDVEEEMALAKRWHQHKEKAAADRLVTSHLRLVVKIAAGYRGYGMPLSELIAEGNVGMMSAINGFDPDRGFRLSTYAVWWIRASVQQYILRNWSLVRLGTTHVQRKLFFKLRRTKSMIKAIDGGDLSAEQVTRIAELLDVPAEEVVSMNERLSERDRSLNAPVKEDGEGEWQDWLVDNNPSQELCLGDREEQGKRREMLGQALTRLTGRERHILVERRLKEEPSTLDVLGKAFGISPERVRQIEMVAYKKLQKAVRNAPGAVDILAAASGRALPVSASRFAAPAC